MSDYRYPNTLMVQGTTSDAGKSILVTALGRMLSRHGFDCAPFKPQNMALNSAVSAEGGEIGRAQAVQAEACGLAPSVAMNPVLLKPNSVNGSQVIVNGRAIGNHDPHGFNADKPRLLDTVLSAHASLQRRHQVVLVEGAGSPAEINLRENDIANMGFAEAADCPVILIADIDRGGVFAHLVGTLALLSDSEQARVAGFVINRFRGDVSLLQSGLDWLEQYTGKPVLGVLPYINDLHIEAEDALDAHQRLADDGDDERLRVVVPVYPHTSNHTDFDALRLHPHVDCQLLRDPGECHGADLIVLPGSKNVRADLDWLRERGWDRLLQRHLRYGGKVVGICGGYQMLGQRIADPDGVESAPGNSDGLGYLDLDTRLTGDKTLRRVEGEALNDDYKVQGYEIHTGVSKGPALAEPLFRLTALDSDAPDHDDGARDADDQVRGSYVHGLFDSPELLDAWLTWAGGPGFTDKATGFDYPAHRAREFDRLADALEAAIPLSRWLELMGIST